MPLLFAATLFVSASLLFMVQPMVGKMVLPLLGGSPAVWNACMVFFQLLLLLGYQYAHLVTGRYPTKKQWAIHMVVIALPFAAFVTAVMFGARSSPIAIVEALAPSGDSSPVLSVLGLLTVAIGIPFFVISTSSPLLQKWFADTGHPSARDPYFLFAASNLGSMISLLAYPIIIEPNFTIVGQAWLFAGWFALLAVMIFLCGRAAANPIAVPPPSTQLAGRKGNQKGAPNGDGDSPAMDDHDPPPSLARRLKWIALAFVPSSLMLGVTFHMTTDIASIPLLWVGPLALYLLSFIFAFGSTRTQNILLLGLPALLGSVGGSGISTDSKSREGDEPVRVVIGNIAPVMILLLVFVIISGVNPGVGITLLLHMLTFLAVAMMCHYEMVRDRPSIKYLTQFYLLMSVGGVLGGIFNSLVAPLVFPHAYEYPLVLILSCLLVPRLGLTAEEPPHAPGPQARTRTLGEVARDWLPLLGVTLNTAALLLGLALVHYHAPEPIHISDSQTLPAETVFLLMGGLFLAGIVTAVGAELYGWKSHGNSGHAASLWARIPPVGRAAALILVNPLALPWATAAAVRKSGRFALYLDIVIPVLMGVGFFFLRQLIFSERFERILQGVAESKILSGETVRIIVLFAVPVMLCFFFVDRPLRFALCVGAILGYTTYKDASRGLIHSERSFFGILKIEEDSEGNNAYPLHKGGKAFRHADNSPMIAMQFSFRRLVHGTTLHGTQFASHSRHILDDFQMFSADPWHAVAVTGATHAYDFKQDPLTYYHRTGPVGAMFYELRTRKNGADAKADVAMVGLGTGSVSCYALPGQRLTFYEIDPAVKHLVADTREWFTFYQDAERRGAHMDIRMGDARLKLKEDTERKYSLLLIDAFSSDSIPIHLLTVEAVQLYMDRMPEDGILALHISNKFVKLEPVVAAIAAKLGLTARVWNDDGERQAGKTASSWVVLARKPEYLGRLYSPMGDLPVADEPDKDGDILLRYGEVQTQSHKILRYLIDLPIAYSIAIDFEKELDQKTPAGLTKFQELQQAENTDKAWLAWLDGKLATTTNPRDKDRLQMYADLIRATEANADLGDAIKAVNGHIFRRLEQYADVPAWTDDYSDVLRVMMIPELQSVRKFFGLPTPITR